MRGFAERRGGTVERRALGELTPALLTGSVAPESEACDIELDGGTPATLAHHSFAQGRTRRDSTVVLAAVPAVVAFPPALVCRDAGAMGDADLAQLPAERWQRVELESAPFNQRYRLYALAGHDAIWLRELFSPSLIAWLDRDAPEGRDSVGSLGRAARVELSGAKLLVWRPVQGNLIRTAAGSDRFLEKAGEYVRSARG